METFRNISLHVEVQDDKGKWHHFAAPAVGYDPVLFRLLQDLGVPGLPMDIRHEKISRVTRTCREHDLGRTVTFNPHWLGSAGVARLQDALYEQHDEAGLPTGPRLETILGTSVNGRPISEHEGFADSRLVFWFRP